MVDIVTEYSEHSTADGVLINFARLYDATPEADLARSEYLILDRNSSYNYTLPFDLTAGKYGVNAYDIERNGTLANGKVYPAAHHELQQQYNTTGKYSSQVI